MIPFTNKVCNDSFEEPKLFKSFKILEITLSTVCFILCFYFIIASFKGEFGVSSKYQLLAKEKALTKELKLVKKMVKLEDWTLNFLLKKNNKMEQLLN